MMPRDPEWDSIAGRAVFRAMRSWGNYSNGCSYRTWVIKLTRQGIWNYWRLLAKQEQFKSELWWERVYEMPYEVGDELAQPDLQLLHEHAIAKWPLDVIARRHGVTICRVKRMLNAAKARLAKL